MSSLNKKENEKKTHGRKQGEPERKHRHHVQLRSAPSGVRPCPGQVSLNEKKKEEIHELYFETMSSLALRLVQVSLSESLFSSVGSSVPFVERSGVRASQGALSSSLILFASLLGRTSCFGFLVIKTMKEKLC